MQLHLKWDKGVKIVQPSFIFLVPSTNCKAQGPNCKTPSLICETPSPNCRTRGQNCKTIFSTLKTTKKNIFNNVFCFISIHIILNRTLGKNCNIDLFENYDDIIRCRNPRNEDLMKEIICSA